MKTFFLMMLFTVNAFAANCLVDGITDSPQKYNCSITNGSQVEKLSLVCRNGNYAINWSGKVYPVSVAYHEEVEEGSNPLVFVSDRLTLTTTAYQTFSRATLTVDGKSMNGRCFDK
jgi:hypothetical protein